MIHLLDGPLAGRFLTDSSFVRGREVAIFAHDPSTGEPREAIYLITNGENGEASFAFWNDQRPVSADDKKMLQALASASDDEIIDLIRKLSSL